MCSAKTPSWVDLISNGETAAYLDASQFCVDSGGSTLSPIDDLIVYLRKVMILGTPAVLDENDALGRVLLLGLVSGVEMYFRAVLAGLVRFCPVSRRVAADQNLSFGAIDYYGIDELGYALLEGKSFSSAGEIAKVTKALTGVSIVQNSSVAVAVAEFERLAHFRHASAHARGELNARNVDALGLSRGRKRQVLSVKFAELQSAALISLNVARAYNRFLFAEVVDRWVSAHVLSGDWRNDRARFGNLVALFQSKEDGYQGSRIVFRLYQMLAPSITASHRR